MYFKVKSLIMLIFFIKSVHLDLKFVISLAPILGDDKYGIEQICTETSSEPMYLHLSRIVIHVRNVIYIFKIVI